MSKDQLHFTAASSSIRPRIGPLCHPQLQLDLDPEVCVKGKDGSPDSVHGNIASGRRGRNAAGPSEDYIDRRFRERGKQTQWNEEVAHSSRAICGQLMPQDTTAVRAVAGNAARYEARLVCKRCASI